MTVKKKRKLNGLFVALVAFILLVVISLFKIPKFITTTKLQKLGYSDETIEVIRAKKLDEEIIENGYYSAYLNSEIVKDDFDATYLRLYVVMDEVTDEDKYLYSRLASLKGYSDEELTKLFSKLDYYNLTPLAVFDKVDVDYYIEDCLKYNNSKDSFVVSGTYLTKYTNVITNTDVTDYELYISYNSCIKDYDVNDLDLVYLDTMFSISNVRLQENAADAFYSMIRAMWQDDVEGVYVVKGYVTYESLKKEYDSYGGGNLSDQRFIRPEYDERQLGYSVEITSNGVAKGEIASFEDSDSYKWLKEHAHEYGYIFRYPENKEDITLSDANCRYLRYVGTDLATKIYESGLTFDEYYYLFIISD